MPARKSFSNATDDPSRPDWPTMRRGRLRNGMQVGVDNSMWLYMRVPMASMPDATTEQDKLDAAQPLINSIEALASMARIGPITQRRMNKGEYREVHIISIAIPRVYSPDPAKELSGFLHYSFPERERDERICLLGVRLRASGLGEQGGVFGATKLIVNATADALAGRGAAPHEFDADLTRVKRALTQAGLEDPISEDYRLADSWWSLGLLPDTPLLPHEDHLHVHMSSAAMSASRSLVEDQIDCKDWPKIRGHHTISIAGVSEFDFEHLPAVDARAQWVISLFDQQAMAVSVRGRVEPVKVTRTELRRNRRRFNDDLNERYTNGKMSRAEEEETAGKLSAMEEGYSTGGLSTLTEVSILAAFSGRNPQGTYDAADTYGIANMATLGGRQHGALLEMMLCSGIRANPYLHDVPNQTISCAGLQSLSQVGDDDGAVLGFTERDGQEVRLSPTAASSKDGLPMMGILGATGSGKTIVLLWLATQFAQMRGKRDGRKRPNIIIDLKQASDHAPIVRATGGRVISLDDLTSADGIFDPLRFAIDPESGIDMAANMLLNINPWGSMRQTFETSIFKALTVGVAHGANCIGEALRLAQEHDPSTPEEMVERVFALAESSHFFRACFGVDGNATTGLRVSEGLTLIKLGKASLSLPDGNSQNVNLSQRVCAELVKMMVFGSAIALTNRGGVLHLDEAWMFLLGEAKSSVEQLGRLARSQNVLPILYTQRCTDLIRAELRGYISRGLILHLKDREEAAAACELFNLEPTPQRIARISAPRTLGQGAAPNFLSMQSLRHPLTGESIRGSIGIHVDLFDRAAPVEVVLPKTFLALASTNPDDIARRDEALAAGALDGFEYDPDSVGDDEEWTVAPIGRLMADVDNSVFANRSLLTGRANRIADLIEESPDEIDGDNPWAALGMEAPEPLPEPEPSWDTSQDLAVLAIPDEDIAPVDPSIEVDEDGWGEAPSDPWAELEATR